MRGATPPPYHGCMARRRAPTDPVPERPAAAPVDPALLRTQRMCERRAFRERDLGIGREVAELARQVRRDGERRGTFAEAWLAHMPPDLAADTWIESATPVQMVVGVPGAATAFAVDRALRTGALARLRQALHAPGLRVRTRIGRSPA